MASAKLFPFWKLKPPPVELLENGDFEKGDFTGWNKLGNPVIITTDVHAGVYACQINSSLPFFGTIRQLLGAGIDPNTINSAGFWAKNLDPVNACWGFFYATIVMPVAVYVPANTTEWTYFSLMPLVEYAKANSGILTELEISKLKVNAYAMRVDDVSIKGYV